MGVDTLKWCRSVYGYLCTKKNEWHTPGLLHLAYATNAVKTRTLAQHAYRTAAKNQNMYKLQLDKSPSTTQIQSLATVYIDRLAEVSKHLKDLTAHHKHNVTLLSRLPKSNPVSHRGTKSEADIGVIQLGGVHKVGETIHEHVEQLNVALVELQTYYDVGRFVSQATVVLDDMRKTTVKDVVAGIKMHRYAEPDFRTYFNITELLYSRMTQLINELQHKQPISSQ